MDIAKDCLTATGYSSGPGAHKVGKDVFLGLNQASCRVAACPACWHRNMARLVAQAKPSWWGSNIMLPLISQWQLLHNQRYCSVVKVSSVAKQALGIAFDLICVDSV